jgi:lysophospholipase L1-like esterase
MRLIFKLLSPLLSLLLTLSQNGYLRIPWLADSWIQKNLVYAQEAAESEGGKVVFLGASIIERCDLEKYYPGVPSVNRGIAGDILDGVFVRLLPCVNALDPKALVLHVGTNDILAGATLEKMESGYRRILCFVTKTNPGMPVIVQSLYPIETAMPQVARVNKMLAGLCAEYGVTFANIHPLLLNKDGGINKTLLPDGIHPNAAGYARIAAFFAPLLTEAMKGEK